MAVRTLRASSALLALLSHPAYTLCRLKAHPLGAPHVARFEALAVAGRQVLLRELDHVEAMAEAQARVVAVDLRGDDFASRLSKAILTITSDDRTSPLYQHYFDKPLNQLTRPVLGAQLATMRRWSVSLAKSPHAALAAMEPELTALIAEADEALAARQQAQQQSREFRDVGERQQWLDQLNAARKEVHGALAKLPHEDPSLPSDFAAQFFAVERGRDEGEDDSVEALRAEAAAARAELVRVEARLAEAEEAEAQRRAAAEARAAQEAALAELDQAAAALAQQRAALQAELAAMPG